MSAAIPRFTSVNMFQQVSDVSDWEGAVTRMEGGTFFKMGLSAERRSRSFQQIATFTRIEGGTFSKWDSHRSAARIRLNKCNSYVHGSRTVPFQTGALALTPRIFVLEVCNGYKDS